MKFSETWSCSKHYTSNRLHGEAEDIDNLLVADEIACLQNVVSKYDP